MTVITSYVIALSAPNTLKRCRPLGALIQHRAKRQGIKKRAEDKMRGIHKEDSTLTSLRFG